MRQRTAFALLPLALALAACASTPKSEEPVATAVTGDWRQVASSATQNAFLDMSSLEQTDKGLKATVKINYLAGQTFGKETFQSVRNVYILDCAGRKIADRENALYAGTDNSGKRINYASRNANNLIWRDAPVASIDGELLTYACRQNVPAPVR